MDYKLITLVLSFIIFTSYVIGITVKFGWLRSVSISWYYIKNKWIFTLALWTFSVLLAIAGDTMLTFLSAVAICFTGAAADAKNLKMTERVHIVGATGGIILGMAALIIDFRLWYFVLPQLIFTILAMKCNMKNHTFWIEIVAYYLIWIGILINIV